MKKLTTEEFVDKANKVHNYKYNYSSVNYINSKVKVKIICPTHGYFLQVPSSHLRGNGCPKCRADRIHEWISLSKNDVLDRFYKVHGNLYDYSEVIFKKTHEPVQIICHKKDSHGVEHGLFSQTPSSHFSGQGCPKCALDRIIKSRVKSLDCFVEEAKIIHNNKFDYSSVNYINNHTKVEIICPEHGPFLQLPKRHLSGDGCPECAKTKAWETKKKNGTTSSSKTEEYLAEKLRKYFSTVHRNYNKDPRYPFACDFYIPERDLFVELNAHWTHGREWYDGRKKACREKVSLWESKTGPQYIDALHTFTERDVLKRKTAKKNNLNYVALWNEQDIEDWFALGCPDGHDGDGMYTWKK